MKRNYDCYFFIFIIGYCAHSNGVCIYKENGNKDYFLKFLNLNKILELIMSNRHDANFVLFTYIYIYLQCSKVCVWALLEY